MNLLEQSIPLLAAALLALMVTIRIFQRRQRAPRASAARRDALDTVQDWMPEPARILTVAERQACELLHKALPGFLVLAQVPLSRFLRVPTRQSHAEWLHRVGNISADLLLCDSSSRVLAVVDIRAPQESERARRRHERMARVLKAAGITVHVWREDRLPEIAEIRASLGSALGALPARSATTRAGTSSRPAPLIPVADIEEILAAGDLAHGRSAAHEPVPSAFFDDMEAAPTGGRG